MIHAFYATQSRISTPGCYAFLFEDVPHDLAGIARITQGLIYHFTAGPAIFGYHPPPERMRETDTRFTERILARLLEMDPRSLGEERSLEQRLVGCYRDNALLACAMLRHQGRSARLRYGFASYLMPPGYWGDHVLVFLSGLRAPLTGFHQGFASLPVPAHFKRDCSPGGVFQGFAPRR